MTYRKDDPPQQAKNESDSRSGNAVIFHIQSILPLRAGLSIILTV